MHCAGHPPGLLLVMHYLGLDTSPRLTAFILFVGARERAADLRPGQAPVRREDVAKIAGLLAAFAPAMLHFGATSADAVYLTLGLLAAIPLLSEPRLARRARRSPSSQPVRLVAAGRRRLGGDPRLGPRRLQARVQARR